MSLSTNFSYHFSHNNVANNNNLSPATAIIPLWNSLISEVVYCEYLHIATTFSSDLITIDIIIIYIVANN